MMNQKILDTIIAWAKKEEPIRALLLTGSLTDKRAKDRPDRLSEDDIVWFKQLGKEFS